MDVVVMLTCEILICCLFRKKWIRSWNVPGFSGAGSGCWSGISRLRVLQI